MLTDAVHDTLAGAKSTLERTEPTTQTVEGNPLAGAFGPIMGKINVPQAHEFSRAPYSMARNRNVI